MFKPATLRAYLLRAREAGYCPEAILKGSGLVWSEIEALQPLELEVIAGAFDLLARRTRPGFAMACGAACKVRDFGVVGFALMSMPTLREALAHWNRFALIAGHPILNTIVEEGDGWKNQFAVRTVMSPEAERFCLEVSMFALEPVIAELTGASPNSTRIDFTFCAPAAEEPYRALGRDDIRFGRPTTAYYGRRADLDRPIPSHDRDVRDMFLRQCAKFLDELTNTRTLADRLGDLMRASAGSIPSLDDMAVALRMSRRSLQRELKAEGISYQELVKQYRMRHAMLLLRERGANVKAIAFALGFKDVASFRRAFQSWTGQAVGEWQAERLPPQTSARRAQPAAAAVLHIA